MNKEESTSISTGYEGPDEDSDDTPEPETRTWEFEPIIVGTSKDISLRILMDKEPIGMIRVPNQDYIRFLRERFEE